MHGPPFLGWALALLCLSAAAYCLRRARRGPLPHRLDAAAEGMTGLGMAVMALPEPVPAAPPSLWWASAALFAALLVWAGWRRCLHHVVEATTMLYMTLVMALAPLAPAAEPGDGSHVMMGLPLVSGALLLYYAGYVLVSGRRLIPAAVAVAPLGGGRPEVLTACRVVMGTAMFAMLVSL
ncbi:DUF5134 domain-containing protein [Streptomyces sp. NPDC059740]|uniref:DUF5134 domain-containing protein n=1 Tax=Streptomyces sp. NPDC059740 TaxID=3346926 RepID=UPI00364CD413